MSDQSEEIKPSQINTILINEERLVIKKEKIIIFYAKDKIGAEGLLHQCTRKATN